MKNSFKHQPVAAAPLPKNMDALKAWMTSNCCNFLFYQIDSKVIPEGFILEKKNGRFTWCYTERGTKKIDCWFDDEKDAVAHAYREILNDAWAWSHMIGFLKSRDELEILKKLLFERKIQFFDDSIPYGGKCDPRYRVFVFGCDILKTIDLCQRFGEHRD